MADPIFSTALEVSNYLLEKTGAAMEAADFEAFIPLFKLPQEMETFDGRRMISDPEEIRAIFHAVRAHYDKIGVTEIVRNCVKAEFMAHDTVAATHETHLLRGHQLIQEPYPCFSVLRLIDGYWQVAYSQYAIADSPEQNAALATKVPSPIKAHSSEEGPKT